MQSSHFASEYRNQMFAGSRCTITDCTVQARKRLNMWTQSNLVNCIAIVHHPGTSNSDNHKTTILIACRLNVDSMCLIMSRKEWFDVLYIILWWCFDLEIASINHSYTIPNAALRANWSEAFCSPKYFICGCRNINHSSPAFVNRVITLPYNAIEGQCWNSNEFLDIRVWSTCTVTTALVEPQFW